MCYALPSPAIPHPLHIVRYISRGVSPCHLIRHVSPTTAHLPLHLTHCEPLQQPSPVTFRAPHPHLASGTPSVTPHPTHELLWPVATHSYVTMPLHLLYIARYTSPLVAL